MPEPSAESERVEYFAALLDAHQFNLGATTIHRDDEGRITGYTLGCACGFTFPPDGVKDHHHMHLAEVLAADSLRIRSGNDGEATP